MINLSPTHQGREHLTHEKERFAQEHPQMKKLEDVVRELKPTAIIGRMVQLVVGERRQTVTSLCLRRGSGRWSLHRADH